MHETVIRAARTSDIGLLTDSWLTSFRFGGLFNRAVPNNLYYYHHHKLVTELLHRGMVLVMADAKNPNTIVGWLCAELFDTALVIHYAYTKHRFRGQGYRVFGQMVDVLVEKFKPAAIMYTHRTKVGGAIADAKGWIYNPYMLWTGLPDSWEEMEFKVAQRAHEASPSQNDSPGNGRDEAGEGAHPNPQGGQDQV